MMNRDELLELAGLDALGILDPDDSERFAAAMRRVRKNLRAEVSACQESVLGLVDLAPAIEDDDAQEINLSLKQRTVGRVMELAGQEPAPSLRRRVLGSIERYMQEDTSGSVQHLWPDGLPTTYGRRDLIERFVAGRVSPLWRVAAMLMIVVTLGMGWLAYNSYSNVLHIAFLVGNNHVEAFLKKEYNGHFPEEILMDPEQQTLPFLNRIATSAGSAGFVSFVSSKHEGWLVASNLPESNQAYRLCVGSPDFPDDAVTLSTFASAGDGPVSMWFNIPKNMDISGASWWIMGPTNINGKPQVAMLMSTTVDP